MKKVYEAGALAMRYRLRSLLIALAIAPPLLAVVLSPVLSYLARFPLLQQALIRAAIFLSAFAVFWLTCGLVWLVLMRALERLLGERKD